jgi:hypothetical protein
MAFTSATTNLQLGPCKVYFGVAAAEVDLGLTKGGVEISLVGATQELDCDQYGDTPIDVALKGNKATVKTPFAEYDLQLFRILFPGSALVIDNATPTKIYLRWKTAAGISLLTTANSLLLKRATNNVATTDKKFWLRFPKANCSGEMTFMMSKDAQQVYSATWNCFPVSTSDSTIALFGDETASGADA